ncbi:hypothetical protein [Thalassiella azotivora]
MSVHAEYGTLDAASNRFDDLAAAFRNATGPLERHHGQAMAGAGEFSGALADGAATFLISWSEVFSVCSQTAGLIAGNIGRTAVDLQAVDVDASTTITL